ncbi:MAG: type IIL restriction-modification enzyme MmeI, partial [Candidatus Saccharimonadales bacterium]
MAALTRNEIRRRLSVFAKEWQHATREAAEAKLFWARFYECFGIRPESATIYEKAVSKLGGGSGFIDSFIPGLLLVEHKSRGRDLVAAFDQASDYFLALKEAERPRYIIVSDFARFRLTDLRAGATHECSLKGLSKHADWFAFLVEDDAAEIAEESKIDRKAAYQVSKLHQALLDARFTGHDLEIFMTRLLFCLFADHTGIFGENR